MSSLARSKTAFNPRDSLLSDPLHLSGDLKYITPLAQVIQKINVVLEEQVIAQRRDQDYDVIFNVLMPYLSECCVADVVALVDADASKIFMGNLLKINEALVERSIKQLNEFDRDYVYQKWVMTLLEKGDVNGAKEKIQCIQAKSVKSTAQIALVKVFIDQKNINEALEALYSVDDVPLRSRRQLVDKIIDLVRFSKDDLQSPAVITDFIMDFTSKLQQKDLQGFYEHFFYGHYPIKTLQAAIADQLMQRGAVGLAMLIAIDQTEMSHEISKDLRNQMFSRYVESLRQSEGDTTLAINLFLEKNSYLKQIGFISYLSISMLKHGLYEAALIQLRQPIKSLVKDRSCSYEYVQVHLKKIIDQYRQEEDFNKVLELSRYIEGGKQLLGHCLHDKVQTIEQGSFEDKWSLARQECFPILSLEEGDFLERYKKNFLNQTSQ